MRSAQGNVRRRTSVIIITLILALVLNLIPYPDWMQYAKPDWVTLVLFYWCLALPHRVGVGTGGFIGLVQDVLYYSLLGQNGIGKAFVAMVAVVSHRRMRMYHLWQQCVVVFCVSSLEIVLKLWIYRVSNQTDILLVYWLSALTTALFWPVIYNVLRLMRQRFGVS